MVMILYPLQHLVISMTRKFKGLIVAGNYREFREFCNGNLNDWRFVDSIERILSLSNIPIYFIGTYIHTTMWKNENQRQELLWRQHMAQQWITKHFTGC